MWLTVLQHLVCLWELRSSLATLSSRARFCRPLGVGHHDAQGLQVGQLLGKLGDAVAAAASPFGSGPVLVGALADLRD